MFFSANFAVWLDEIPAGVPVWETRGGCRPEDYVSCRFVSYRLSGELSLANSDCWDKENAGRRGGGFEGDRNGLIKWCLSPSTWRGAIPWQKPDVGHLGNAVQAGKEWGGEVFFVSW